MDILKPWIINRHLTSSERIALDIVVRSAGFSVYPSDSGISFWDREFPYITFTGVRVCGRASLAPDGRQLVDYEWVMDELVKLIKNE